MGLRNAYKKGRKAELERVRCLELAGYKCLSAPKGNRFTKQKDLFDHWDIVAYFPKGELNGCWLVEQVKSSSTGGVLKKLKEASLELPPCTKANLVIRIDGKKDVKDRWRVINLRNLCTDEEVDDDEGRDKTKAEKQSFKP